VSARRHSKKVGLRRAAEECILCRCRYCKFDTFHPAVDNGLPVTRVISRVLLQEKLAEAARRYGGDKIIQNDCHVVDFEEVLCCRTGVACAARLLFCLPMPVRSLGRVRRWLGCTVGLRIDSWQPSATLSLLLAFLSAIIRCHFGISQQHIPRRRWTSHQARSRSSPYLRMGGASRATS